MSPYHEPKLYWWRVEIAFDHARVFTMIKAENEGEAIRASVRERRFHGQEPVSCSQPVCLGDV